MIFLFLLPLAVNDILALFIVLIMFGLPTVLVLIIWLKIIFTIWGYTCISISKDNIEIKYQIFGFNCFKSLPILESDIYKLELVDKHVYDTVKNQQQHLARLSIFAGISNYELNNFMPIKIESWPLIVKPSLTLPEIYWLAEEVSEYLDLPIQGNNNSMESDNL